MISEKINLDADFYGKKTVIVGKSGSGKSYTSRVVIEEGLKQGVSFLIIDPQSAYENFKGFEYANISSIKDPKKLGIVLAATARNIVISTKGHTIKDQQKFVKDLLESYRKTTRKGIRTVVIDECHKFAPEYDKAESKEEIRSMSQENRSDGLGFIAVEQRTQRLDKTVLSQADLLIIHKLSAKRDLMAIENYLDNPKEDLLLIKKLDVGEAYFYGFDDEPITAKVRKAETKHSGEAPKNLLTEDKNSFNYYRQKLLRGKKMDNVATNDLNTKLVNVPSMQGFNDLVMNGAKMSLGLGAAGLAGAYAARIKSPVPVVSSRTLAGAAVTLAMYTAHRKINNAIVKDVSGYAAAGSAVGTAGSLIFDGIAATGIQVPNIVSFLLNAMTGISPMYAEGKSTTADAPKEAGVDLNTKFS